MLEVVDHRLQLGCLTTLRDQDRDVTLARHAEITVDRLREMKERRRGTGGSKGRCDFAADMTRFAEPANDQFAATVEDQSHRFLEWSIKAVRERIERDFVSQAAVKLDGAAPCGLGRERKADEWRKS